MSPSVKVEFLRGITELCVERIRAVDDGRVFATLRTPTLRTPEFCRLMYCSRTLRTPDVADPGCLEVADERGQVDRRCIDRIDVFAGELNAQEVETSSSGFSPIFLPSAENTTHQGKDLRALVTPAATGWP